MESVRIVEVPEEVIEALVTPSTSLFSQSPADDFGSSIFRCCGCGETHAFLNETGIGYRHVRDFVICCVICEAESELKGAVA